MNTIEIYKRCQEGLKFLWANRLDDAEKFFSTEKETNARYALHYTEVSLYRTIITELASDRDESTRRINHVIKLAEKQIKILEQPTSCDIPDRHNQLLDSRIILADAQIFLAAMLIIEEARVKGILSVRKAWKLYKQALASVPLQQQTKSPSLESNSQSNPIEYYECVLSSLKFGAGLFYFLLSFIPPGIAQKAAAMAGFSGGNKELGLQFLNDSRVAEYSLRSHMASIILAFNLLLITVAPDEESTFQIFQKAEQFINPGLEEFPTGCVFQATSALALLEGNRIQDAFQRINEAINNSKHITDYPAIFLRVLSNIVANDYDWEKLLPILQRIVDSSAEGEKQGKFKNPWSLTWNSMRLASCQMMLGQTEKAKTIFREIANAKKADRWSEFIIHLANKYLKTGGHFSFLEIMLLTQYFEKSLKFSTAEKKKKILTLLETLAERAEGSFVPISQNVVRASSIINLLTKGGRMSNDSKIENRVTYLTLKGTVLRYSNLIDDAMKCFQEVIDSASRLSDKYFYAASLIQVAKIQMKSAPAEAIKNLNIIQTLVFPFDSAFKSQARAYTKYIAEKNASIKLQIDEQDEQQANEEELDEKNLEKMLNDEDRSGLKDD